MTKKPILIVIVLVFFLIIVGLFFKKPSTSFQAPQTLGKPLAKCLLFGEMRSANQEGGSSFEALGRMVRLHFDTPSLERCKEMATQYCHDRFNQGYVPQSLTLIYRQSQPQSEVRFLISKSCMPKLETGSESIQQEPTKETDLPEEALEAGTTE